MSRYQKGKTSLDFTEARDTLTLTAYDAARSLLRYGVGWCGNPAARRCGLLGTDVKNVQIKIKKKLKNVKNVIKIFKKRLQT